MKLDLGPESYAVWEAQENRLNSYYKEFVPSSLRGAFFATRQSRKAIKKDQARNNTANINKVKP